MSPLGRDVLKVFHEGDEYPGIIVYGLAPRGEAAELQFPSCAWERTVGYSPAHLHGARWEISSWEIRLERWPDSKDFVHAIQQTMLQFYLAGYQVSWVGAEGLPFCDPPFLFSPQCMSGGVLAWMTSPDRFDCPLDPAKPLCPIDDYVLRDLRAFTDLAG